MSQALSVTLYTSADAPVDEDTITTRQQDILDAQLSAHGGTSRPAYAIAGTVWRDTDTGQLYLYDGTNDLEIAVNAGVPASTAATGFAGQVAWDDSYFYICTATDTWKRVAVATW